MKLPCRPRNLPTLLTLREVAARLGLSPARVGQLERQALARLASDPVLRQLAADLGYGSGEERQ